MDWFIHPSAVVDERVEIGQGTMVWHFSHLCSGAKIGERVTLGQNVYVGGRAVIGSGCKIQNNVSVYDNVILAKNVFCGPSAVFTNVEYPRAFRSQKKQYIKTIVEQGASLGANCTILCGVTIGEFAFVGAGAFVNKDVKPFALVVGVPARQIGWMTKEGENIPLPIEGSGEFTCENDERYILENGKLTLESECESQ